MLSKRGDGSLRWRVPAPPPTPCRPPPTPGGSFLFPPGGNSPGGRVGVLMTVVPCPKQGRAGAEEEGGAQNAESQGQVRPAPDPLHSGVGVAPAPAHVASGRTDARSPAQRQQTKAPVLPAGPRGCWTTCTLCGPSNPTSCQAHSNPRPPAPELSFPCSLLDTAQPSPVSGVLGSTAPGALYPQPLSRSLWSESSSRPARPWVPLSRSRARML